MKYRKITDVEAIQWDGNNETEELIKAYGFVTRVGDLLQVITDSDILVLAIGEYIVKNIDNTFKLGKDYFEKAYKKINE